MEIRQVRTSPVAIDYHRFLIKKKRLGGHRRPKHPWVIAHNFQQQHHGTLLLSFQKGCESLHKTRFHKPFTLQIDRQHSARAKGGKQMTPEYSTWSMSSPNTVTCHAKLSADKHLHLGDKTESNVDGRLARAPSRTFKPLKAFFLP